MNEKNFCSFYKLNDDEIKKLKEKENTRNPVSAPAVPVKTKFIPKGKIVAVAVSLVVVIFGVMIGINAMPDRNSGNNGTFSEPEPITTEKITTTKKTDSKKEKTTATKTELAVNNIEIPFTIPFPEKANGRFAIDFVITNEDGSTSTESTNTLLIPEMNQVTHDLKGSGENVSLTVVLTNLNTHENAHIGTYTLNFSTGEVEMHSEDIVSAFIAVGGLDNEAEIEEIKIDMNRHYCTHCDSVLYESDAEKYNLYDSKWGIPFSLRNIYVDENEMLIGLFEEDFDLSNVEKEIDTHEDGLKEYINDDFYFFDYTSTRYTIKDLPDDIEGIPEDVMPDYIVIDYSPEGDVAIGHRYCTRVHFCFDDKPIGYNFEFVKGKDLLEDEIETLKEHIKEYGLTQ